MNDEDREFCEMGLRIEQACYIHKNWHGITMRVAVALFDFAEKRYYERAGYRSMWEYVKAEYPYLSRARFRQFMKAGETCREIEKYYRNLQSLT